MKLNELPYNKNRRPDRLEGGINNVEFIALYLLQNGPSQRREVQVALCDWRKRPRSYYTDYFHYKYAAFNPHLREGEACHCGDLWVRTGSDRDVKITFTEKGLQFAFDVANRLDAKTRRMLLKAPHIDTLSLQR